MRPEILTTSKVMKVTVGSPMVATLLALCMFVGSVASAQSKQYQRKSTTAAEPVGATIPPKAGAPGATAKDAKPNEPTSPKAEGDKLDISELEQKYWAPKDTDFSVVQNRTYTKAERFALTPSFGPAVNNTFSAGNYLGIAANYYFSERSGVEFQYMSADLKDSDSTKKFRNLSGGATAPDFNREKSYLGIGYNFVPFYAKMSFMGKKIIYFDMQITPTIGLTNYEQQTDNSRGDKKSAFAYGVDVTQYFFFSNHFAVRLNLHNRWSQQEEVKFKKEVDGSHLSLGSDGYNDTNFMVGLTWFLGK